MSIQEIIKNKMCTGCGVCVSESEGTLKMEWDAFGFLMPTILNSNIPDGALRVCPFNSNPEEAVRDEDQLAKRFLKGAKQYDPKIGKFENTYVGYSTEFRNTSSSGGLATFVFEQLLQRKIVDHLYIVKEFNGTYEYHLFSTIEDIKAISKTRYIPVTLEQLFTEIKTIEGRIAISGVGCFIKAIRLKQYYHPELKEKIPFLVGIICGGWKSRFFTDFLAQSTGIHEGYHHQEYRIKDYEDTASGYAFGAFNMEDNFYQMKMSKVGDMWGTGLFKSRACDFCTDVLTELADISLGDAWLPEYRQDGKGNSIIVTRSLLADIIIQEGINDKLLEVMPIEKEKIIQSQKSSFSHRHDAIQFRKKIAKLTGMKIPYIRKRILKPISITYSVIQMQRLRIRKNSLIYWQKTKEVKLFNHKMNKDLLGLSLLTMIYHKLRNI